MADNTDTIIQINLWNVNGPSNDEDMLFTRQEHAEAELVWQKSFEELPDAFMLQEITTKKMYNIFHEDDLKRYNKGASLLISDNNFSEQKDLQLLKLKEALESNIEIAQFQASTVIYDNTGQKILFVSCHAVRKTTLENRKEKLDEAIRFFRRVQQLENCEIVFFGGDFNYECKEAEKLLDMYPDIEIAYPTEGRRVEEENIIDYLLAWPKEKIRIDTEVVESTQEFQKAFDHDIVKFTITILPRETGETEETEETKETVTEETEETEEIGGQLNNMHINDGENNEAVEDVTE